jgi:hypothetical protein
MSISYVARIVVAFVHVSICFYRRVCFDGRCFVVVQSKLLKGAVPSGILSAGLFRSGAEIDKIIGFLLLCSVGKGHSANDVSARQLVLRTAKPAASSLEHVRIVTLSALCLFHFGSFLRSDPSHQQQQRNYQVSNSTYFGCIFAFAQQR